MTDYAYHWSPASRAKGIARSGLKPGSLSRNRKWRPPFISFSRDPTFALGSANAYWQVEQDMDLWQIDLGEFAHEDLSDIHDEIRIYERIPYRHLTYIATRPFATEGDDA